MPSNTTHELQPLGKSVFCSFEYNWDQEVQLYWLNHGESNTNKEVVVERIITKQRFGKIFSKVWDKCMTPSNIKSGFKACRIVPFDPSVIPETAFAPSTKTEMSDPENSESLATSTPICSHRTAQTVTEELSPQPGPSGIIARPDIRFLPDDKQDPVETAILNERHSSEEENSDTDHVSSFEEIIPTPKTKTRKATNRKPAINSRGVHLEKKLFPTPKEAAAPSTSCRLLKKATRKAKVSKSEVQSSRRMGLKHKSVGKKKNESWFCQICKEDIVKDMMRKCEICNLNVHEE